MTAAPAPAIRRRVVVATPDTVTPNMAGPAIRAWNVAIELSGDHDVTLVSTARCDLEDPRFATGTADDHELRRLERWCDILVVQGWLLHGRPYLLSSDRVVVVDAYDPMHLEQLEHGREAGESGRRRAVRGAAAVLNEQLLRADFIVCASEAQRRFWLGHLAALGRVNPATYDEDPTLRSLVDVVPFGMPAAAPVGTGPALRGVVPGIGAHDRLVLWGGGIYNWFDPLTLLRAVDLLRARIPDLRLFFMGTRHPNPEIVDMGMVGATRALAGELGLTGRHVFFNDGWVPYDRRQDYLLEADVGVSTHLDHVETTFSSRTRVLDYLWAGLPVVVTSGDPMSELVEQHRLGLTVAPGDVDALAAALARVLTEDGLAGRLRARIEALAPELRWSKVLQPLTRFCSQPRRAPDLLDPELGAQLRRELARAAYEPPPWRRHAGAAWSHLRSGGVGEVARYTVGRARRRSRP